MKVGVVGCGAIARRGNLPAYRNLEVDIVGVADLSERKARSCAKKFKIKKWYMDYNDLLREDLDLVSVCTPNSSHCEVTINAAKAGVSVHAVGRDYIDVMSSSWRFEEWGILEEFAPHIIDIVNFLFELSIDDVKVIARGKNLNTKLCTSILAG